MDHIAHIFIAGSSGEMFALKFASAVVVSSISNLTLVWQVLASVRVFHELSVPSQVHWMETFHRVGPWRVPHTYAGSFIAVVFSPPERASDSNLDAKELIKMWGRLPFAPFAAFMLVLLIANSVLIYRYIRRKKEGNRGAVYVGIIGGVLAAFSVTLSKITVQLISKSASGDNQFDNPYAFVMVFLFIVDITGVVYVLNLGLKRFEAALFVPMYEILENSSPCFRALCIFKRTKNFPSDPHLGL